MTPLDEATLRLILTTPKNALIKQYTQLFKMDGIELQFTPGALDYIVEKLKPWHFFVPFTNLTLVITTISICKSISASIYKSAGPSDHFFYTMAIIMNCLTVCSYWTIIHKTKG